MLLEVVLVCAQTIVNLDDFKTPPTIVQLRPSQVGALGVETDNDGRIMMICPQSDFAKLPARVGDFIVGVDGVATTSTAQRRRLLQKPIGTQVPIAIFMTRRRAVFTYLVELRDPALFIKSEETCPTVDQNDRHYFRSLRGKNE